MQVSFGGDENVLELDSGNDCTTLWIYQTPLNGTLSKGELHEMWIISQQKERVKRRKNKTRGQKVNETD